MNAQNYSCVLDAIDTLLKEINERPGSLENLVLDDYLEAMRAWLEGYQLKHHEPLTWEFVAKMIRAASIYE